jgi:raffinose/stachyose/melibiose transport system permease protein
MFEVRSRGGRLLLQLVVTLLVLPFLFPLVAMVQGSLAGDGWGNYAAVLAAITTVLKKKRHRPGTASTAA